MSKMNISDSELHETIESVNTHIRINYYGNEVQDITGAAHLAIAKCINTFDRTKGVLFKTYAYRRAVGAIKDYLKALPHKNNRRKCRAAVVNTFSDYEKDDTPIDFTIDHSPDYDINEIREKILLHYKTDPRTRSLIKPYIIVEHFIDGTPKYLLAAKYNITTSAVTYFTDVKQFMDVLKNVLDSITII